MNSFFLFGGDVRTANPTADIRHVHNQVICSVSYQRRARRRRYPA